MILLRQVHALEHGTISLLAGATPVRNAPIATDDLGKPFADDPGKPFAIDDPRKPFAIAAASGPVNLRQHPCEHLGGITTEEGFYLYGHLRRLEIVRAVRNALDRLTQGEWHLAIHPRCSTTWPVPLLLQSALTLGLHVLLPKTPFEQLVGVSLATTLATELAPDAEMWWQRYMMTAIPFNLEIVDIEAITDDYGTPAHFVRVRWVETENHA